MAVTLQETKMRALRQAIASAVRAPSVHNTQPWTFEVTPARVSLRADRRRQLPALDPTGRQLLISCGCALLNLRVALAASGFAPRIDRFPDTEDPDLLAVVDLATSELDHDDSSIAALASLEPVLTLRHTNRRRFADDPVPPELIETLCAAAAAEDGVLHEIRSEQDRMTVAELSQRADAAQCASPAYRAELRAWTTADPNRRDGVPALAVPHVAGDSGDEVPIRDFDSSGSGWLPTQTRSSRKQCLLLMCTDSDNPRAWLRAGEALERVLLEVARHGFTASPLTQIVEVSSSRAALRSELSLTTYPHVLLRVGRAAATPGTTRRALSDVVIEVTSEPAVVSAPPGRTLR